VVNGELIADDDDPDFPGEPIGGTFTVSSLAEWNAAIAAITNGGNDKNYIINVTGNFSVPGSTADTFGTVTGITVSLRGNGTLAMTSTGYMIRAAADQTVILRDLTLQGRSTNNTNGVVRADGVFVMHSGTITGNAGGPSGGGVSVYTDGTFTMYGGEISGNTATSSGGGGYVASGTFVMYSGTITGNTAGTSGGGVFVNSNGTFRLVAGTIYGSNATLTTLRNNAPTGAALALYNGGTAQRGTFAADGITWIPSGTLANTSNTINVKEGELIQ
jgi:hypothetical protein